MDEHPILLVTQYDGGAYAGWQRQPDARTVQGEMERVLSRLAGEHVVALAAGRTDAGVHAHGQAVGVRMPRRWEPAALRRAVNALLPSDIWVASAFRMRPEFHPRRSALGRHYGYLVGTDASSHSPFRRRFEWALGQPLDGALLQSEASALPGDHVFRAFAVARTAPGHDHHRCIIQRAVWHERDGGWLFEVEANRFLHHMVRFLVGTMIDVARGRRPSGSVAHLLTLDHNAETSAPAPASGLSLRRVHYPDALFDGSIA